GTLGHLGVGTFPSSTTTHPTRIFDPGRSDQCGHLVRHLGEALHPRPQITNCRGARASTQAGREGRPRATRHITQHELTTPLPTDTRAQFPPHQICYTEVLAMRTSLAEVARMRAQAPMSDVGVRRLCAGVRGC